MNLEYDETYILLNVPALFINLDFSLNPKFKATTHQSVSPHLQKKFQTWDSFLTPRP